MGFHLRGSNFYLPFFPFPVTNQQSESTDWSNNLTVLNNVVQLVAIVSFFQKYHMCLSPKFMLILLFKCKKLTYFCRSQRTLENRLALDDDKMCLLEQQVRSLKVSLGNSEHRFEEVSSVQLFPYQHFGTLWIIGQIVFFCSFLAVTSVFYTVGWVKAAHKISCFKTLLYCFWKTNVNELPY